jgi:hypothetical protein
MLPKTVAGTRKTEWRKPISAPLRRQVKNPIQEAVVYPVEQEIGQVGEDS